MLAKRHGEEKMATYHEKLAEVEQAQREYQHNADHGQFDIIYKFGQGLVDESGISIDESSLTIPEFKNAIALPQNNPFADMV